MIAARWGVDAWPSIFVIDARGMIRYRSEKPGGASGLGVQFEKVLGEVLKEAEGAKPPSR
jgi:hypothetical protein